MEKMTSDKMIDLQLLLSEYRGMKIKEAGGFLAAMEADGAFEPLMQELEKDIQKAKTADNA